MSKCKTMEQSLLRDFLNNIAQKSKLIAPVDKGGSIFFKGVTSADDIVLDYVNSMMPPKDFFFPRSEKMFSFDTAEPSMAITPAEGIGETVLFGVRPCDVRSISILDKVFDSTYKDELYLDKRNKTTLIALSCNKAGKSCFCSTFGISPGDGGAADLLFTLIDDTYLVEVLTEKGEKLVQTFATYFKDTEDGFIAKKEAAIAPAVRDQLQVSVNGVKEKLDNMFDHPIWDTESLRCLGCGTCTFVCPTCHCFDIIDYNDQSTKGYRYRCIDSCQFANFTKAAGGHQPRPSKKERIRQRFMHKLRYFLDRDGVWGCVGCGRCVDKCPVNLDIVQIIKKVEGANL